MNIIAIHRVTTCHGNLLPVHFVIAIVWMTLTCIVLPAGSTSCRTSHRIVDTVFPIHRTNAFKSLMCDDVISEHIEILLNLRSQILAEFLCILNEVRIDVSLKSTDSIVVHNESTASCLLHNIEHMLTVAHAIQECCECSKVLSCTAQEQQVAVDSLQLIHDSTDVADAV